MGNVSRRITVRARSGREGFAQKLPSTPGCELHGEFSVTLENRCPTGGHDRPRVEETFYTVNCRKDRDCDTPMFFRPQIFRLP